MTMSGLEWRTFGSVSFRNAICVAFRGKRYELELVDPCHLQAVPPGSDASERQEPWIDAWKLSPRLADVCRLLLQGLCDKDIAAALNLSPTSVSTYARQIYRRAGVHARAELAIAAWKMRENVEV